MNDSPWSLSKVDDPETAELVFDSREKCTDFLDELLKHKMFHRAKKIPVVEPLKPGKKKKKVDEKTDGDETDVGKKQDDDDKKKKRKIRLDMHLDQVRFNLLNLKCSI
jgi:translocation protein SEC62